MSDRNPGPEERREWLRQEERKRNPLGNMNDAHNGGGLTDLIGMLGWKTTGVVFSIMIVILLGLLFI
ncbi:DUF6366 family protein [Shouchella hunanensis]|uniref:DUF6366 family protein n=1 Tax=Shouchella hunanensis TaxID=766894 RepID=A0ABY7WDM0_9BACI|nr:DUF6366 family protein [Shouchella hunanensis]RQW22382.1 hypothetical protein EH196_00790 [Bacillus sp. C1-1]WDF05591.1 DUF6366 family protein [Shouchella hunanensis]